MKMEEKKDIKRQQLSEDKMKGNGGYFDNEDDDEDEEEMIMNAKEQLFLQQQMEQEYLNAFGEDSDDGLVLADSHPMMNPNSAGGLYPMMMGDNELDKLNYASDLLNLPLQIGWIQWFLAIEDHELLIEVEREFILDKMNLLGVRKHFPSKERYKECLKLLLSNKVPTEEDLQDQKFLELNTDTSDLFGLVHARYVQSPAGLAQIYGKYLQGQYGHCPRAFCDRQRVIPVGTSDKLKTSRLKVYCPRCDEIYLPKYKNINIDGAFFGTSIAHIFMATYSKAIILPPSSFVYEPQIFGFKLFGKRGSKYYAPAKGSVRFTEDEENVQELVARFKEQFLAERQQQEPNEMRQKGEKKPNKKQKHKKKAPAS